MLLESGYWLELGLHQRTCPDDAVYDWATEVSETLGHIVVPIDGSKFQRPKRDFTYLMDDTQYIEFKLHQPENYDLMQSYLELGIDYLKEVKNRMTDYTEASGQGVPGPTYSVKGNVYKAPVTVNGSQQIADRIVNRGKSMSNVVYQGGDSQVGAALAALEDAILADTEGDDDLRGHLLGNLENLTQEANRPPEERRAGVMRSLLAGLQAGPQVQQTVESWKQILETLGSIAG